MELDVGHVRLVPGRGGEVVNGDEARWTEILCDTEELVVTRFRRAAGERGPDLHVHRTHADGFYVLEGELVVPLGPDGEPERLPAGTLALAPPLLAHAFRMDANVEFLNVHAPGAGFTRLLRGEDDGSFDQEPPPAGGGRPRADAVLGGEVVADRPGLRVVLHADEEQLAACEVTSAPGGVSSPPHVHRRHSESFYVLAGELVLVADGEELVAGPGAWAHVPAGVPHTVALRGETEVRFLDLHTPGCGFGDFVRALHTARGEAELDAARARFDQDPA